MDVKPGCSKERPRSPEVNCAICLDKITNKAFVESCLHEFCFTCIRNWARIKAECPLCKTPIVSVLHNVRAMDRYDVFVIETPEELDFRLMRPLHTDRHERHLWAQSFRRPFVYTGEIHPGYRYSERGYFELMPQHLLYFQLHNRRAEDRMASSDNRRIYRTYPRVTPLTARLILHLPHYYRHNPAMVHLLVPWICASLRKYIGPTIDTVPLCWGILNLLADHHILTVEFHQALRPFLGHDVVEFSQLFFRFACSIPDMAAFDTRTYDPSSIRSSVLSPPYYFSYSYSDLESNANNSPTPILENRRERPDPENRFEFPESPAVQYEYEQVSDYETVSPAPQQEYEAISDYDPLSPAPQYEYEPISDSESEASATQNVFEQVLENGLLPTAYQNGHTSPVHQDEIEVMPKEECNSGRTFDVHLPGPSSTRAEIDSDSSDDVEIIIVPEKPPVEEFNIDLTRTIGKHKTRNVIVKEDAITKLCLDELTYIEIITINDTDTEDEAPVVKKERTPPRQTPPRQTPPRQTPPRQTPPRQAASSRRRLTKSRSFPPNTMKTHSSATKSSRPSSSSSSTPSTSTPSSNRPYYNKLTIYKKTRKSGETYWKCKRTSKMKKNR